jgi:hypothetical protein
MEDDVMVPLNTHSIEPILSLLQLSIFSLPRPERFYGNPCRPST